MARSQLHGLESMLRQNGDFAGALEVLDRIIGVDDSDFAAFTNKGGILLSLGRPQEALSALRRAVELEPEDALALHNFGECLRSLGRPEDAIPNFEKAIANGYSHPGAYYNLGCARLIDGDLNAALADWGEATRRDPGYAEPMKPLSEMALCVGVRLGEPPIAESTIAKLQEALGLRTVTILRVKDSGEFNWIIER